MVVYVSATNIAVGKPAFQSSTYAGGTADRAVDGITLVDFYQRSCSHTKSEFINHFISHGLY